MEELEKYYSGDESWQKFVDCFDELWEECKFQNELIQKVNGDIGIAMVIYGKVGPGCLRWMDSEIPALDEVTPQECINDPKLLIRLKSMLMRFP